MAGIESSRLITKKTRRKVSVNSTAEIQWVTDLSTIGAGLGLKKAGSEYKGSCPVCGGRDRFWMRPGREKPIIFACRMGCSFPNIVRALESRGWVHAKRMPREEWQRVKLRQPAQLEDAIQAEMLCKIVGDLCEYALTEDVDFYEAQLHFFVHSPFGPQKFHPSTLDEAYDLVFEAAAMMIKARDCGTMYKGVHNVWR